MNNEPAPTLASKTGVAPSRVAVVILGMHRSGTSALTKALSVCGYALPRDVMPAQKDNPHGFHEPLGVVKLNNAILSWLGTSWERPGPFLVVNTSLRQSRQMVEDAIWTHWRQHGEAALARSFGPSGDFVIKDPRICFLLPFWNRLFEAGGIKPFSVMIHRNPLEVAASLRARNGIGWRPALQLWQICHQSIFQAGQTAPLNAVLSYANLVEQPVADIDKVLQGLGRSGGLTAGEADAIRSNIDPELRTHRLGFAAVDKAPQMPALVRDTWNFLNGWNNLEPETRRECIAALDRRFEDAVMFGGPVIGVSAAALEAQAVSVGIANAKAEHPIAPQTARPQGSAAETQSIRPEHDAAPQRETPPVLILHYHLFKNAGTSVDEMLKRNFGERWATAEFRMPGLGKYTNVDQVTAFLESRPNLLAFSSHTALLPLPQLAGRIIFPILFIRHPIDRLMSAYTFERKQIADTHGARLAKQYDLAGYLRSLLGDPRHRQVRNFQTSRLAGNEPPQNGPELERAMRTLDALPFVGLVEDYDRSIKRLEQRLRPLVHGFTAVSVHRNRTQESRQSLDQKLDGIRRELGQTLYDELCKANADDLAVFAKVRADYDLR